MTIVMPTREPDLYMLKILRILAEVSPDEMPSNILYDKSRMFPGKFYPALMMLEQNKLVASRWGDDDAKGRKTRLYKTTDEGMRIAVKHGKELGYGNFVPAHATLTHG